MIFQSVAAQLFFHYFLQSSFRIVAARVLAFSSSGSDRCALLKCLAPSRSIRAMSDAGHFTDVDGIASHLLLRNRPRLSGRLHGDDNAAAEHPMVDFVEQQLRESLLAPIVKSSRW